MTQGHNETFQSPNTSDTLARIRAEAADRYGKDAEFAYRVPGEATRYAMLTLDQAIEICGKHIAGQSSDMLWTMLDQFHSIAEAILRKDERVIKAARAIGQQSLRKYQA